MKNKEQNIIFKKKIQSKQKARCVKEKRKFRGTT